MKSFKIILFLLFFFSLQSCGGEDDGYITIDIEQRNDKQNEKGNNEKGNNEKGDNEEGDNEEGDNEEGDNNNTGPNDYIPTTPNDNINSSKAYLYYERFYSDGISHQSAACYGDYAFFISSRLMNIMVFNMQSSKNIYVLNQSAVGSNNVYHCNQACFGTQKYSEEDPFPLLYISQFQNKDNRCFITVFRVLPTSTGTGQEYTAFAFERIQTIFFPVATDENSLNNVNAVIDTDHHFIYTYSRNNNADAENYMQCKISKFNIPNPLESSSVYLSDSDILDSYFIPAEAANMQGGAYNDGLLYIGRGKASVGYINLYVIDLANRKLWFMVDLYNHGFSLEPEGAYFYKDDLYIGASRSIFKFTFKYENSSAKAIAIPFDMPE